MSRIFISYRRTDAAAEAGRIYDYLENHFGRESIFKDVDTIDFGDNFRDRIHEAVGQCQILLAVIGKNWLQAKDSKGRQRLENPADWVRLEVETALKRDVRVIPVLLDGVEMPSFHDLPEALQPLAWRNAARIRHDPDFRRDIERIIDVIERSLTDISNPTAGGGSELPLSSENLTSEMLRDRAQEKYEAKDYHGALTDCDEALRLQPDYAEAYNGRGAVKRALGDEQGALLDFSKALHLKSDYATPYRNRGLVKKVLGDEQGALLDLSEALRLKPDDAAAYYHRGIVKKKLGHKQEAILDFKDAVELYQRQGAVENYELALNQLKQLS